MVTRDDFSAIHRLKSDEVYHFYQGDPVEMLQLFLDGTGKMVLLGNDLKNGARPQVVVPGNTWQGSRLAPGGSFALLGTTVVPGFEFEDFELGKRESLIVKYPQYEDIICRLTRG